MPYPNRDAARNPLLVAYVVSIALHAAILFVHHEQPPRLSAAPPPLSATLAPRTQPRPEPQPLVARSEARPQPAAKPVAKPPARPRILAADKGKGPAIPAERKWSAAEKQEMDRFLEELGGPARPLQPPSLAQRSLAMAREYGRQQARQEETGTAILERRPDSPPPDPFSLDLYMDGLIRRLNKSATFVRNDPRAKGVQKAAVQFRLNPDGSLKSFTVLNEGDQAGEIAYIRAIVERAAPFSPFPPDIDRAARSLGVTICIQPASGFGGFGFARMEGNRC
jgi:hypothetical protein